MSEYATVFAGDEAWKTLPVPEGDLFDWIQSTYVQEPPFFEDLSPEVQPVDDIRRAGARAAGRLGHDRPHFPRRRHRATSPAAQYLKEHGVKPREFNSLAPDAATTR